MSISWETLKAKFGCALGSKDEAEVVFDGNAATIRRAAEIAREDGDNVVEEKHFKELPEGYPAN